MWHSLKSVIIFGFSGIPLIFLIRMDVIGLLPNSIMNTIIGLIILVIWNEIHFFMVHRLMHVPFFMKHVHIVHHRSRIPTVYAVYSFHWFEALLLSTVPITIAPIIPLSATAIFLFPLVSILLNYSGHCNYRFGKGKAPGFLAFGTNHNHHHSKAKRNYGFASGLLDRITHKIFNKS
ncbi:sterol desaturase family protein [Fulvivirga sp. 29W222]|uniref:Sterol desaturase family protein n=1 Tax=Fulvivirga marina TaxID=2494733 RepID=A0A937KFK3_9BACT|nr:sterol desaturase family protein [Fulvivirga marina]